MPGYLIANITVTDGDRYAAYREKVPPVVKAYGGRFLVRAGAVHSIEGDLGLDRLVVIEFPSVEAARSFYDSAEYAPLLTMRMESTRSNVAIVEGFSDSAE